jgi:8-oxo-dGTP pyrophosphatase MutT (NUDIX family)
MPRLQTKRAVSAGGVVYRADAAGQIEILLCGRSSQGLWALPKGTPDGNETLEQTAMREVEEETGLKVSIRQKIGAIRYWFTVQDEGVRYYKTVHYFLMDPIGGDLSAHDWEFDTVQWFPYNEALQLMTYTNEATMVQKAGTILRGRVEQATRPT